MFVGCRDRGIPRTVLRSQRLPDTNIKNKDYTKGGTVSTKDAMEEFNKQFDDEKNKSNACGGIK